MSSLNSESVADSTKNLEPSFSESSTLVGSVSSQDSTSTPRLSGDFPIAPITYNIGRFKEQNMYAEGTIHGRVSAHAYGSISNTLVPFYQARAAAIIAAFDIAFLAGSL